MTSFSTLRRTQSRSRRTMLAIVLGMVALGLAAGGWVAVARAADAQRPHEITAIRAGSYYSETRPNIVRIRLPGQEPYSSRDECLIAIKGARVDRLLHGEPGWRLRCDLVEPYRVF